MVNVERDLTDLTFCLNNTLFHKFIWNSQLNFLIALLIIIKIVEINGFLII